jgi:GntR family transcriptional regulator
MASLDNGALQATVVDKESRIPAFLQIEQDLRRQILSGNLVKGCRLPRETVLAERYHASRVTVRRALEALSEARLVERVHGLGTLVTAENTTISCDLNVMVSFADQLTRAGYQPKVKIDRHELCLAPEETLVDLRLSNIDKTTHIRRIIEVEDRPLVLNRSWLPSRLFPDLENRKLHKGSLWKTLKASYKVAPLRSENRVDIVSASFEEASMLFVEPGTMLFRLIGVVYDKDGLPLEYCTALWSKNVRLHFSSEGQSS